MYVLWVPPFNSGVSLIIVIIWRKERHQNPPIPHSTDVGSSKRNTRASFQRWEPHRKEMEENQQARILRAWQGLRLSSPVGGGWSGGDENQLHSQIPYNKNCKTELLRPPNVAVPNASLQTDVWLWTVHNSVFYANERPEDPAHFCRAVLWTNGTVSQHTPKWTVWIWRSYRRASRFLVSSPSLT